MIDEKNIIASILEKRCYRKIPSHSSDIEQIVEDCCRDLDVDKPEIIFCETLKKSFSTFYFRKKSYLIYDSCLMESLYVFDHIVFRKDKQNDLLKLCYKLIGEELLLNDNLPRCLYFSGKYKQIKYSFEEEVENDKIKSYLNFQNYFLIGHELAHLRIKKYPISKDYFRFAMTIFKQLEKSVLSDMSEESFIHERYAYFLEKQPSSLEEYYFELQKSPMFKNFIEECYCDFQGIKLLLEHYEKQELSIRAIFAAMNYLVLQESIRSEMQDGTFFFGKREHEVRNIAYYSVMRMEMMYKSLLVLLIDYKKLQSLVYEVIGDNFLFEFWSFLDQTIPPEERISRLSEGDLPNIDRKKLKCLLMKTFYFTNIG